MWMYAEDAADAAARSDASGRRICVRGANEVVAAISPTAIATRSCSLPILSLGVFPATEEMKGGVEGGCVCLLQDELPWDILVRVAIWLDVRDLGRLASVSHQLSRLGDESAVWRALFGRAFPCRTALADKPDWRRLLRRNYSMLADNPGDHLWIRVAFGTLTVPVPYAPCADPGALLLELKQLMAPCIIGAGEDDGRIIGAGEDDVESVCLQRLEASMVGFPLLLLQHGRLVSALGGEDGWVGRRDVLRAPTPPQTMGQLCLPAVCDVRLSILRPTSGQGQRASSAAEARAAAVEESIQSAESAGPSWIMLRVLIPHLGSAQGRPAHAGKDGGPASPFKWRAQHRRQGGKKLTNDITKDISELPVA